MEDVYLIVSHTPATRTDPEGSTAAQMFVEDLDAALATLEQGTYTIMHGKREDHTDVPKQLRILKKLRRKPKDEVPDPLDTEEVTE